MSEFRVVTREELCPIVDTLVSLPWPVQYAAVPDIVEQLGWTLNRPSGGKTTLPVSFPTFRVGELYEEISNIDFRVSDTFIEPTRTEKDIVKRALPGVVESVASCVGFPPTGPLWVGGDGVEWDLPDGRRINLFAVNGSITLEMWSKRNADIERRERRWGLRPGQLEAEQDAREAAEARGEDPDRDPDDLP